MIWSLEKVIFLLALRKHLAKKSGSAGIELYTFCPMTIERCDVMTQK